MAERKTTLQLALGGKVRTLRFDFAFLDALVDRIDLNDLDILAATRPWRLIPLVATAALTAEAEAIGSTEVFDEKTVGQWIAGLEDPLQANQIKTQYETSMGFFVVAVSGVAKAVEAVNGEKAKPKKPSA